MAKSDLLKQAIADANAVKETALANAKIALQEAFAPRIQSMLSTKLSEELEDEEEANMGAEGGEEMAAAPEASAETDAMGDMPDSVNVGLDFNNDGDWDLEGMLGAEDEEEPMAGTAQPEAGAEPEMSDEEAEGEYNEELNLEQIIRELESDLEDPMASEGMYEGGTGEEGIESGMEDDDMMLPESLKSSGIGKGNGKPSYGKKPKAMYEQEEDEDGDMISDGGNGHDEDMNIDEIIEAILREEDGMEGDMEPEEDVVPAEVHDETVAELQEAYRTVRHLKGIINEVNLLNAKLLYTNKLFRNFELNEGQKMKVIENFDRAGTTREVKLVFTTLAESFKRPTKKRVVKESYASRPVTGTAPSQNILNEGFDFANRWKKLAGLL